MGKSLRGRDTALPKEEEQEQRARLEKEAKLIEVACCYWACVV